MISRDSGVPDHLKSLCVNCKVTHATMSNIYAKLAQVNRRLNSVYFMLNNFFRKYFRYARMTSFKISNVKYKRTDVLSLWHQHGGHSQTPENQR